MDSIINLIKKCWGIFKKPWFPYIVLFPLFLLLIVELSHSDLIFDLLQDKDKDDHLSKLHNAIILLLTLGIVAIAWIQLTGLNRTSNADFLLRIDNHYGSREILKAREIIHRFHLETPSDKISKETHIQLVAEKVKETREQLKKAEDFIYLLNLLDFLETIAYFARKKHIDTKEIDELLGGSIVYYYKVFKVLITHIRKEHDDDNDYYCEIKILAETIDNNI